MQRSSPSATTTAGAHEELKPDLCIIGAGAGGSALAAAAAQAGASVVLLERHRMGGDSLNYACVPTKALAAAARRAQAMRTAGSFGITPVEPVVDAGAVHAHVRATITACAPNVSVPRLSSLGVRVVQAAGRFYDASSVIAGDYVIKAHRFVVATGSSPSIPAIPGLSDVPYFTNETVLDFAEPVEHLIVIGAGPTGLELAQAFRRFGSRVTVLEIGKGLAKDDPELSDVVFKALRSEGIFLCEGSKVEHVEMNGQQIRVSVVIDGRAAVVEGSSLLVATGRRPNTADLNLDGAGVKHDGRGILVDNSMQTSNRKVLAIGDVAGGPQFAHAASYQADVVLRRLVLQIPASFRAELVPRVTYTSPEIAQVGLSESEASVKGGINVHRWPFQDNDRARTEHSEVGFVKVITDKRGRILGAGVVGESAGEIIQMWSLAVSQRLNIDAMTQWIAPYPTLTEINRRVALGYYGQPAKSSMRRRLTGWLTRST